MSTLLLEEPAASRQSGGAWDYISPSRLNLWLRCPLAWRLKYIDGLTPPITPSLFLGKQVHDALEVYYRHRHLGCVEFGVEGVIQRVIGSWDQAADAECMHFDSGHESDLLKQQTTPIFAEPLLF